jgi:hypothetical protein
LNANVTEAQRRGASVGVDARLLEAFEHLRSGGVRTPPIRSMGRD